MLMTMMMKGGCSNDEYDDNKAERSIANNQRPMAWSLGQLLGSALDGEIILNGPLIWPCYQAYHTTPLAQARIWTLELRLSLILG